MSYAGSREFHDLIEIFECETEKRFVALSVNWNAEAAMGHITRIPRHWGALGEKVRLGSDWTSPAVRVFGEAVLAAWAYGVDHHEVNDDATPEASAGALA